MEIKDIIYGKEEITEPVLIDLINSYPLQRLKGVSQFGLPEEYYHKKVFSRFEHSIGVLILLRRLDADLEEQIAGLLHDVSHTAFSHLIDWVVGDSLKEDHQDKTLLETIEKTEIKKILGRYKFDYREIADIKKYPLLEQEAPFLCADRIDYCLREIALLHNLRDSIIILNSLENKEGKIVFNSLDSSKLFAAYYTNMNRRHWAGEQTKARWYIFAEILKKALNQKIISFADFMTTDNEILSKLKKSENEEIIVGLNLLKNGFTLKKTEKDSGIILKKKFRYIDPWIFLDKEIVSLSKMSEDYQKILNKEKEVSQKKTQFLIIPNKLK